MSFLDGILKPGEGARLACQRELEARRDRWSQPGYYYRGAGDFLLQHGRPLSGRELPDRYAHLKGAENQCFWNALAAAEASDELSYCEGVYALGNGHFTHHAWCVDPNGLVVEVTFPTDAATLARAINGRTGLPYLPLEHWLYWGAVVHHEYVRALMERNEGAGCVFDRSAADLHDIQENFGQTVDHTDYPLLRQPYDPNRRSL